MLIKRPGEAPEFIPFETWDNALKANGKGIATQEQIDILKWSHILTDCVML